MNFSHSSLKFLVVLSMSLLHTKQKIGFFLFHDSSYVIKYNSYFSLVTIAESPHNILEKKYSIEQVKQMINEERKKEIIPKNIHLSLF